MIISVVIPNYNGKKHLKSCLKSLRQLQTTNYELQTIIVDNGSTDGSVEFVKKKFPQVKIIALNKNYGFAKAVNEGIQASKGEYIALLNNDTKVDQNWLTELIKVAKQNPQIDIFASNILSWDGKKIDSQGIRFFWKGKAEQINQGKRYQSLVINNKPFAVFGACAAAALYKRDIFEKIGFFDEVFFAYLEDVDFSFRAQLVGEKCLFVPNAIVYHQGGATRKRMGNFKARMDAKNWIFLIIKNYPMKYLFKYFFQIFIERLKNFSGLLKQTPLAQLPRSIFQTYGEVLIRLSRIIARRNRVQKLRKVSDDYLDFIISLHT